MTTNELRDEILGIIRTVFDDKPALEKIHKFLVDEIYSEPDDEEIPDKYKKVVSKIADSISYGLVCFLNPDTLEMEDVPDLLINDPEEYELMTGETEDSLKLNYESWNKCITINQLESHDSFKIMELFANKVDDSKLQDKLFNALSNRKPFANFKWLIDNSEYRQQWFDFRQKQYEQYVWREIDYQLTS